MAFQEYDGRIVTYLAETLTQCYPWNTARAFNEITLKVDTLHLECLDQIDIFKMRR